MFDANEQTKESFWYLVFIIGCIILAISPAFGSYSGIMSIISLLFLLIGGVVWFKSIRFNKSDND